MSVVNCTINERVNPNSEYYNALSSRANSNVFEQTKSRIDKADIQNELDCIQTIVLNISEYCSLKCSMCPRSIGYPNRKTYMNPLTILNIKKRLQDIVPL